MPIGFAASDPPEVSRAPFLGEHTEEVLAEVAGYTTDEVDRLTEETGSGAE
jgi:crotonobetainyl-CoA:carnitine CoA-transferase CaiB-like acyl-CoA transferase